MSIILTRFSRNFQISTLSGHVIATDKIRVARLHKSHILRSISSFIFDDENNRQCTGLGKNSLFRTGHRTALVGVNQHVHKRWLTGDHAKNFNFIADAVEIASPAVVYVEVAIQQQGGLFGGGGVAQGAGSGFIVTDYGIILTNAHVVANSTNVSVKMASGDVHKAEIQDIDPVADLAVLKIKPNDKLPTIKLGNSATLRPGEWVIALGSPLNLSNTVTAGIVSTVHRGGKDIGLRKGDMKYIQTDAAINKGNSGGPLINLDAEVIGINTMTLLNTTGISFAVPIDRAKAFLLQALEKQDRGKTQTLVKKTQRPYIGIKMLSLYPQIEGQLRQQIQGFPDVSHGILVVEVVPGSPAQKGGLQPYDVITEVDDVLVSSSEQLHEFVRRGREMNIKVIRPGNKRDILRIAPILQ